MTTSSTQLEIVLEVAIQVQDGKARPTALQTQPISTTVAT
jgi:hypothetical protein